MDHHSSLAHSSYINLLRSLKDDAVSDLRGTPNKVMRGTRGYWYDTYRVGNSVHRRYIGEDSSELKSRIDNHRTLRAEKDQRQKHQARLVKVLRAEGFMGLDVTTGSLLAAMSGAGVFRLGGTIVGTHAFRLYEGELGLRFTMDQSAHTDDIDIASFERLSIALEDTTSPPMIDVLKDFKFEPAPDLVPGATWRWRQTKGDAMVEFLTPSFSEEEGRRSLPALGVQAQALHHLNYLLSDPIQAAVTYRSGVLVQIPRPEKFAVHKLIVADRRREGSDTLKAHKDRKQAEFLIEALTADRPDDLIEAFEEAAEKGEKWRLRIGRSLAKLPTTMRHLKSLGLKKPDRDGKMS